MRAAIIGVGGIGFYHAKEYRRRGYGIVLCDRSPERLECVLEHPELHGATGTADWKEIARDESIDVVSVCTPTSTHLDIAREMLSEGKLVMLEKPMGVKLDEALKLAALSRALARPGRLCIGYQYHLLPFFQALKASPPGDIATIRVWAKRLLDYPPGPHYCGPVRDILVHMLQALFHALPKLKPLDVKAEMRSGPRNPFKDEAWARLVIRFRDCGAVMVAETAYESDEDKWGAELVLCGDGGRGIECSERDLDDASFVLKMERWMDCVEGKANLDLESELETALDVERVAEAAHASAENGSDWVKIAA